MDIVVMEAKYRKKKHQRCKAGEQCKCVGRNVLQLLDFYYNTILDLEEGGTAEAVYDAVTIVEPCFLKVLGDVTRDMLNGEFPLPAIEYRRLVQYKTALLKIFEPRSDHVTTCQRLSSWSRIFPNLLPRLLTCLATTWELMLFPGGRLSKTVA
jgi:hypothetical protein